MPRSNHPQMAAKFALDMVAATGPLRSRLPPGGATAGDDRKMNNEPLEREPIDRVRARLEALLKANAALRCGARTKRTGKSCRGAAMPNGRCKLHGGKSTGPRTPEGLERSRRANWKHGHFSRERGANGWRIGAPQQNDVVALDGRRVRPNDENHRGTPIPQRGSSPNPTQDQANPC